MARVVRSVKKALLPAEPSSYQSIPNVDYGEGESNSLHGSGASERPHKTSVFEYGIFMLLGVAMWVVPVKALSSLGPDQGS